jgi:ferredoxin-NADP reductase
VLVVNGEVVAVSERVPGHVVGDGSGTIKQLVDIVNSDPRRGVGHEKVLTRLELERPGFRYRPVLSGPPDAGSPWDGRRGLVHEVVQAEVADLAGWDVYATGPPAMIEAIRAGFVARGLPREQLYFDSFDYAPDTLAKLAAAGAPAG